MHYTLLARTNQHGLEYAARPDPIPPRLADPACGGDLHRCRPGGVRRTVRIPSPGSPAGEAVDWLKGATVTVKDNTIRVIGAANLYGYDGLRDFTLTLTEG